MMPTASQLLRLFHTVRYLRPVQVTHRLGRVLRKPRISHQLPPARRLPQRTWERPARRPAVLLGPSRFRIFHQEVEVDQATRWQDPQLSHLVQYNLHYFDDLKATGAEQRTAWHRGLIHRWIDENPPGTGPGWEPYPLSLRIVNWIQWALAGNQLSAPQLGSLATQVRWLSQQLEFHLLANHLLVNLKALVFAGAFFQGQEAQDWLSLGGRLLQREIDEQILADGGHFELSPMYHSLILEDLMDLLNLGRVFGGEPLLSWTLTLSETITRMRAWLKTICHPDGQIALFNDAAWGIAPEPHQLEEYAQRLGLGTVPDPASGVTHLTESGYVRVQQEDQVALLDVARVGPDYQPGHAHADTLSFEWSWSGDRVFVNSGTSCYGRSTERLRQRSTSAHNTVEVDGQDSSEVWSSFRVARRARPLELAIEQEGSRIVVTCAHSGYRRLPGRVTHRRRWSFARRHLGVQDWLDGRFHCAVSRLRVHPQWQVSGSNDAEEFGLTRGGRQLQVTVKGAESRLSASTFHPQFGLSVPCGCLESRLRGHSQQVDVHWDD